MPSLVRPLVSREQLLSQMRQRLVESRRVVLGQPDEHGGNGRTTLALQYANQFSEDYGHVFRLRCETESGFRSGLLEIAVSLSLPERFARQPGDPLSGFSLWLQSHENWLVILDDVHLWEYADRLTNPSLRGDVIVVPSTAAPPNLGLSDCLAMPRFNTDEAIACLADAIETSTPVTEKVRHRFIEYGGKHPLALRLMSGALQGTQRDPEELLKELSNLASSTTAEIPPIEQSAAARLNRRISRLVEFSLSQCTSLSPLSEPILLICSYLDAEHISESMLTRLIDQDLKEDGETLRRSLALLSDFGLLNRSEDPGEYGIHPHIQLILRDFYHGTAARQAALRKLIRGLTQDLESIQDDQDVGSPVLTQHAYIVCSRLTRRDSADDSARLLSLTADRCAGIGATASAISLCLATLNLRWSDVGEDHLQAAHELERLGDFYRQHQQPRYARRGYRQALTILRKLPDLPTRRVLHLTMRILETDLAESLLDRARTRLERAEIQLQRLDDATAEERGALLALKGSYLLGRNQGSEAISTLERALQTLREVLPEDDAQLLKIRTVLGRAYFAADMYGDAERILLEDLRVRNESESIGDSNLSVPTNLLGELYLGQGRFAEAEPLFERVLRVREATLGPKHRLVGEVANRLAVVKGSRGDYAAAEPLFRRTLTIHEALYGEYHPEVARVLNDLAEMLYSQAKHDPARRLLERALMIQQKRLRQTDDQLARTRNNLAAVYVAKGLYEEAEFQFQRDLDAKRQAKEINRPGIATALNNLGDVWRAQGRYSGAEEALREALALREDSLGDQHPLVAQSQSNLGYVLLQRRKLEQAAKLFEKSLAIRERCLSARHPHIAATLNNLAEVRLRQQRFDEARELLERSLDISQSVYGEQSAQTAAVFSILGRVELRGGSRPRAELQLLKAQGIQNQRLAPHHRHRARNAMALAELYLLEDKRKQAEDLLVGATTALRNQPGGNPLDHADALFLLGRLYSQTDRYDLAEPRLRECLTAREQSLGDDHPDVGECLSELGAALHARGISREAERMLSRALAIFDVPKGWDQPEVDPELHCETLGRMADVCCEFKEIERAEAFIEQQRRLIEETFGPDDDRLAPVLSRLAGVYYLLERYDDAAPLMARSLEMAEGKYGPNSPETAKHIEGLAGVYALQKRFDQAETLMQRSVQIVEDKFGPMHDDVAAALEKYVDLLRKADRHQEADRQHERVEQIRGRESHVLDDLF